MARVRLSCPLGDGAAVQIDRDLRSLEAYIGSYRVQLNDDQLSIVMARPHEYPGRIVFSVPAVSEEPS